MRNSARLLFIFIVLPLLSSCATLSKQQCMQGDWYSIGYKDGVRGYDSRRIEAHKKACAEFGVTPRMDAYIDGHSKGIQQFCLPTNAYRFGMNGNRYRNVCPPEMAAGFRNAYEYGFGIFRLRSDTSAQYDELKKLDHKLHENHKIIKSLKAHRHHHKKHSREWHRLTKELRRYRHERKLLLDHRQAVLDRIDWLNREIDARVRNNPYSQIPGGGNS